MARSASSRGPRAPLQPRDERGRLNTGPERIAWAALLLLVALAFSPSNLVQFTLPKLFWLRALACAIALIWSVRCWRGDVRAIPWPIVAAAGALFAWWTISTIAAIDPVTAMHGMHGRSNGFLTHAVWLLLFIALASAPLARPDVETIVRWLVLSLAPVALYALAQQAGVDRFVWPNIRPGSTIGHPVPLAAMLALALPFLGVFALTEARPVKRWLWIAMLGVYLFAVAATLSRGPWAGLIVALGILIAATIRWKILRPGRSTTVLIAALLAIGIVASSQLPAMKRAAARLATLADLRADPSFMGRFVYFEAAARMLRDHPVSGVGFESYGLLYPRYRPVEGESVPGDSLPSMVHNGYLQIAVTNGVPALAFYLALVASVVVLVWRRCCRPADQAPEPRAVRVAMMGAAFIAAIAGYLVQDMSGWEEISLSTYFWILLGAAVAFSRAGTPARRPRTRVWQRGGALTALCAAFGLAVLSQLTLVELRADRHFYIARHGDVGSGWEATERRVIAGLQLMPNDAHYADAAGLVYLRRVHGAADKAAHERAARLFDQAAQRDRFNPYILIHRIDLDTTALQRRVIGVSSDAARRAAAGVVAMDPNNSTTHEAVARLALAEGRAAEALTAIRRAGTLRPHHVRYNRLEGDALRMLGDVGGSVAPYREECRLLEAGTPDWVVAENKLILALLETGQHEAAATEATQVLARVPSDVMTLVLLGFASGKMGAIEAAHDAFAAALAIDSTNTAARQGMAEVEAQRAAAPEAGAAYTRPRIRPR